MPEAHIIINYFQNFNSVKMYIHQVIEFSSDYKCTFQLDSHIYSLHHSHLPDESMYISVCL